MSYYAKIEMISLDYIISKNVGAVFTQRQKKKG